MKILILRPTDVLLVISSLFIFACKKSNSDTTDAITCDGTLTYTANAKAIITKNCTTSGCHNAGSSRGDFTTYAGLKPYLNSGDFYREVITTKDMPQGSSLSEEEYNALYCWAKNNYAE